MRKCTIRMVVLALLVALVGLLGACGGGGAADATTGQEEPAFDGRAVLQDRCTVCHSLTHVTGASKSESGWARTVERMIGYGADLDSAERDALVAYLTQEYGQ